jgi:hypothetical protein
MCTYVLYGNALIYFILFSNLQPYIQDYKYFTTTNTTDYVGMHYGLHWDALRTMLGSTTDYVGMLRTM